MFAYDKTFDPKVVLGQYNLISRFSDFPLYLRTQLVDEHKVFLGHCDLISWFNDFVLYLDTQLVFFHTSF